MHSFSPKILVRSHTSQIQSIRKSISQRPHTIINQSSFTFQTLSFYRATDQPDILPKTNQSRYVSVVSLAFIYVFAISYAFATNYACTNASVYIPAYASGNASTNAPVYIPVYAFTYALAYAFAAGYEPATNYASKSIATST